MLPERNVCPASIADLMRGDVWAQGMVFYNLINPNQRYPYLAEIKKARMPQRFKKVKTFVLELLPREKKPLMDQKYQQQ